MIVVGAIVGYFFDRAADRTPKPKATKQLGVLLASGLIVGESTIGVVLSAIVVFSGVAAPLALVRSGIRDGRQNHRRHRVHRDRVHALSLDPGNGGEADRVTRVTSLGRFPDSDMVNIDPSQSA